MDVGALFSSAPAAPANQGPAAPAPGTNAAPVGNGPAGSGLPVDPAASATNTAPATPADPFAEYANVWNAPVVDPNAPAPLEANQLVQFDPNALGQAVRRMDFTRNVVTPELMTKVMSGDVGAFQGALNTVAQNVMHQMMNSMTGVVNGALGKHADLMMGKLQPEMKRMMAKDGLGAINPALNNPAVAPVAQALTTQLTQQHPGKSVAEIHQMVNGYLTAMGNAFKDPSAAPATTTANTDGNNSAGAIDWMKWGQGASQF